MYTGTASSVERLLSTVSAQKLIFCLCEDDKSSFKVIMQMPCTISKKGITKVTVNSASNTTDVTEREEGYAGISG